MLNGYSLAFWMLAMVMGAVLTALFISLNY